MEITRYGNKTMYKPRNFEDVQRVKREYEIKRAEVIEKNIRVLDKAAEEYDHNLELLLKKDTFRDLDNARIVTEQMITRLKNFPHSYDGRKEKALEYQRKLLDSIIQRIENFRADNEARDSPILQRKAENEAVPLPKELDNDEAKAIFTKAVGVGLMEVQGNGYEWHKSKVLLAYMLNKIYTGVFPATELDKLFRVSGLKQAVYSLPNNKQPPKGYEAIDRLFEEA